MIVEGSCFLMDHANTIKGILYLTQTKTGVVIKGTINGLAPGKHGFHIHQYGDMTDGCQSMGTHYNYHNLYHGNLTDTCKHMGDLGNITADNTGKCYVHVKTELSLNGLYSIVGRSMVVHEKEDDLGRGGNEESKKTGNSGNRLLCGIIAVKMETSHSECAML